MIPDKESLRIITGWINDLSRLVRHTEEKPTKDQLAVYATMLARDLPSGAFNADSLHAVYQGMTFWPDCNTIRTVLVAWWREHKPYSAPQIASDLDLATTALPFADRIWFDYWIRRQAVDMSQERRNNLDHLVRSKSPAAWRAIKGADWEEPMPTRKPVQPAMRPPSLTPDEAPPERPARPPHVPAVLSPAQLQAARTDAQAALLARQGR